ncbi:MAG TPA: universal stress protein, partial [Chloroflexota bacterium]|nr:universal stress protein [Chloroflexota bacterium]
MGHGILVPLDGSDLAGRVVPYAEELAAACDADLVLARMVANGTPAAQSGALDAVMAIQHSCVARGLRVQTIIEGASPASGLLSVVARLDVALLVMSTHGGSGPSRWVIGSVGEQLLRRVPIPALLLTPAVLDSGTAERLHRRVIVPVDGSELSRQIYPAVRTLAGHLGAPITLVRALETAAVLRVTFGEPFGPEPSELRRQIEERMLAGLRQRAREWSATGLAADAAVVPGHAATAVLALAAERGAGWLAMAAHGEGGHGGQAFGSTALAILRQT